MRALNKLNINNYNPNTTDRSSELLTLVNKNDYALGSIDRKTCHNETTKPWHRSTHIYLFDNNWNLYLSQRGVNKDTAPGKWTISATGHIRFGSNPYKTAKTELFEELKIKTNVFMIDKLLIDYGSERETIYIFAAKTNDIPKANPNEVLQLKKFELSKLISLFTNKEFDLSGGSRDSFKHVIKTGSLVDFIEFFSHEPVSQ